ncbi:MAG TPA: NAD-dependent epimerase/dehydratase family protein [Thermomicrobiales bacterium]|nr:NAD-dependent epimerase/dehydratase family protein [Thermomicrobiales bacterium]
MQERRSVLVTGGAGFIGSNVVDHALAAGHHVTVFDDLSRPHVDHNIDWLRERHGDAFDMLVASLTDADACERAVQDVDVIYHLAGQTAVTRSVADPRRDFEVNALGTLNVLEAGRLTGRRPIVLYSSTNKVYGAMEGVATVELATRHAYRDLPNGVDESQPLDFHSPYGCSKGAGDQYVRDYARIYDLPTVVFRQSCIYGPRQMGVEDQGWLAWFVIALATDQPITIYGDGKQVRDVLYIDDLLKLYDAAVERIDVAAGQIYNVGGGPKNAISIWWELKPLAEEVLGRRLADPCFDESRPGDQAVFIADIGKARRELGWEPSVAPQDGIRRLTEWITANRDRLSAV